MVLENDQNVFLASLPSAGYVDVVVENVDVDFGVVAGKLVVDMAADMVADMALA